MAIVLMEDLHELWPEIFFELAESVEAGPADPENVYLLCVIRYLQSISLGLMFRVTNRVLGSAYRL